MNRGRKLVNLALGEEDKIKNTKRKHKEHATFALSPSGTTSTDCGQHLPEDAVAFAVTPTGHLEPLTLLAQKWSPQDGSSSSKDSKRKRLFVEEQLISEKSDFNSEEFIERAEEQKEPPKKKRKWDRRNCCFFCEKLVTNFSRHMINNHGNEEPVLKYIAIQDENLKVRKQRRQEIFDDLRRRGNFKYNQNLFRESFTPPTSNMILPVKRTKNDNAKKINQNMIICKYCCGYFCRKTFYKHVKACNLNSTMVTNIEGEDDGKFSAIREHGLELHTYSEQASSLMKEKIFPLLRKDQVGLAAMNDPLIVSVGNDFLSNHLDQKDKYNITSHMRDAGLLLLKMKEKDGSILSLKDCLTNNQLENLTNAVQEICKHDDKTGKVGIVGGPARMAWVIKECTSRLLDDTLCNSSLSENLKQIIKGQLLDFQLLIKRRWKYIVSTNAEKTRKKNCMKKEIVMPDNEDIKKFLTEVTSLESIYSQKLLRDTNVNNYERLCEAIIAKLIVLNRRRSGEVANVELEFYLKRPPKGNVSQDILDQLNEEESQAFKHFDMMIIPGKIIRAVPILMTKETATNIDLIISCRSKLGIPESNKLLFAKPGTNNPFVGSAVMRLLRNSMNLKKPDHLTATGLRHHCATMSHYSDKALDKEDLAEHMGHTLETHKRKYRFPLEVVQKGRIAPHLLKLGGLTVDDIESKSNEINHLQQSNDRLSDDPDDPDYSIDSDWVVPESPVMESRITKKKIRWSEQEKEVVIDAFKDCIRHGRNPGSKLCRELIEKEAILNGRTWKQVNVLIDNYNKGKISLPLQYRYLRS